MLAPCIQGEAELFLPTITPHGYFLFLQDNFISARAVSTAVRRHIFGKVW